MNDRLKQLDLLISQTAARMENLEKESLSLRHRLRQQEEQILRLKETEKELKALREWKKNTVSVLKKMQMRIDKAIARAQEKQNSLP